MSTTPPILPPLVHQMMTKFTNKRSLWEARITSCLHSNSGAIPRVFLERLQALPKGAQHLVHAYNSTIRGPAKSMTAEVTLQPAIDSRPYSLNKLRKSLILSKWYAIYFHILDYMLIEDRKWRFMRILRSTHTSSNETTIILFVRR